jgi:hypothetical protein
MIKILRRAAQKGPVGAMSALWGRLVRPWHIWRVRSAPEYHDPSDRELADIEIGLRNAGIVLHDYLCDERDFDSFVARMGFPQDYHGGERDGVYREKLLEHFVAWEFLDLGGNTQRLPYVDIAGAFSPWAKLLRDKNIEAFSIDLASRPLFAGYDYYLKGDATASPFGTSSVGSASLQCAYEMFVSDADTRLIVELARILRPGGRAVISPLYTHTHACYYQTPEYFGRPVGDADAFGYVRRHAWGVPASRKYSAASFRERVWDPAIGAGLIPEVHVLRNRHALGPGVYLHFILTLDKPRQTS